MQRFEKDCALVVLGSGVERDCGLTRTAKQRVEKALSLYEQGVAGKLVLSGSHPFYQERKGCSEAEAMASFLQSKGVPREALILEECSTHTLENAFFTKKLIEKLGVKKVILVTSDFHAERALYLFSKAFGDSYELRVEAAPSNLAEEALRKVRAKEERKLAFAKQLLREIPNGDEEAVLKAITLLKEAVVGNFLNKPSHPLNPWRIRKT